MLCLPGKDHVEGTIDQYVVFHGLRAMCRDIFSTCNTCQQIKCKIIKYGKLLMKVPEVVPWEILCVDYIGKYIIPRKRKPNLTIQVVTMIDPVAGWFKIAQVLYQQADHIANLVEQYWLTRYQLPKKAYLDM